MIKKFEGFLNESRFSGYDDLWIPALRGAFDATVKVDKTKQVKPIYGGGSYDFIGYEVQPKDGARFILEGLQINGCFAVASVIVFKGGQAVLHAGIDFSFKFKDSIDKNTVEVLKAVKKIFDDLETKKRISVK